MKNIRTVFFEGHEETPQNLMKNVKIDIPIHKKGIFNIARMLQPDFEVRNNKEILNELLLYFSGNPNYQKSLSKGIMVFGPRGTGKSLTFEIFKKYTSEILKVNSFQMHNFTEIRNDVAENGTAYLDKFRLQKRTPVIYIDDIGKGLLDANYFGTKIEVLNSLIDIRHICFEKGILTHASTNMTAEDMRSLDSRTLDRMKQMFNVYPLVGKSYRK